MRMLYRKKWWHNGVQHATMKTDLQIDGTIFIEDIHVDECQHQVLEVAA